MLNSNKPAEAWRTLEIVAMGCYTTNGVVADGINPPANDQTLGRPMYDAIWIFALVLVVLIAVWTINRTVAFRPHRGRRLIVWAVAGALLVGASVLRLGSGHDDLMRRPHGDGIEQDRQRGNDASPIDWVAFNSTLCAETLRRNQPVFIKYTADWCARCQANETRVLKVDSTRAALSRSRFLAMSADMTVENKEIESWLEKLGRVAPPAYVIYLPDGSHDLLPDSLSSELLNEHIERASTRYPPSSFQPTPPQPLATRGTESDAER